LPAISPSPNSCTLRYPALTPDRLDQPNRTSWCSHPPAANVTHAHIRSGCWSHLAQHPPHASCSIANLSLRVMAGALSKRQQARNEKVLQDLVRSVPGNSQCADCHALNPAWASWSVRASAPPTPSTLCPQRARSDPEDVAKSYHCAPLTPRLLVGRFPVHAMCRHPPKAGHTHLQSQDPEHG
jgi:hypothetical protein